MFLLVMCVAAISPVEKVVQMLEDLQDKVVHESKEEAKTYNEFACFCKDTGEDKRDAIDQGTNDKGDLESQIGDAQTARLDAQEKVDHLTKKLQRLDDDVKKLDEERRNAKSEFDKNEMDYTQAIEALTNALEAMESSQRPAENARSFLSTVQKAIVMGDALGFKSARSLLQQAPDNQIVDYEYHQGSKDIITILKELLEDFTTSRQAATEDEIEDKNKYDSKSQSKRAAIRESNHELEQQRQVVSSKTDELGSAQQDLTEVTAKLNDDQVYLTDLNKLCDDKKKTWDQRQQMRSSELTALVQATEIIKDTVTKKTTQNTVRFIQNDEDDQDADEDEIPVFIQTSRQVKEHRTLKRFLEPQSARDLIVSLLRQKSAEFRSAAFASLASKAAVDPFKKIKILIQELVNRLLEESQNDQEHNNWCKTETEQATQQRDIKAQEVRDFNNSLEKGEAHRDKLADQIKTLKAEMDALTQELEKQKQIRTAEKEEYSTTKADAEEGQKAINDAEGILKAFYSESATAQVNLLHHYGVEDDAPDAGFKNMEAYKGSQSASKGILGMIDVIKSDFQRTLDESKRIETERKLEFVKFRGENRASYEAKELLQKDADTVKNETEKKIEDDTTALAESQSLLDSAVTELIDLNKACVKTEMSYEERVKRREQEISALKQALCILDKEGPVQSGEC